MNWSNLLNSNRLRQTTRSNPEDARNAFESDFGRIIFSPALRRMHDKTQVFPLTTDDNIHSRLTHSMEVLSIGYSMGVKLSENEKMQKRLNKNIYQIFREIPVILKNSCLLHDIGNPPFGHFGETVIQQYFEHFFKRKAIVKKEDEHFTEQDKNSDKLCLTLSESEKNDFIHFDGNAQGLRVLTKLQILDDIFGLNLTYATLGSYIKYPNYDAPNKDDKAIEKHKLGVFQSELDYFKKISEECGIVINGRYVRHPLCYLMEAADSICYLTMDIEDGFNKGLFNIDYLSDKLKNVDILGKTIQNIVNEKTNNTTKIVRIRIELIQYLVNHAINEFVENIDKIENGVYNEELIFSKKIELPRILREICVDKIFSSRDINSLEITGHSVMSGLIDYYIDFLFKKNKDYKKRAQILISSSIIRAAIEENFDYILKKRKRELMVDIDKQNEKSPEIKNRLANINETEKILVDQEERYGKEPNKKIELEIKNLKITLRELIKPKLDDLNDYYKLRVIVDFISGMTDQYALNHFRKISGQQIS